jgi:hypothetical protein
LNSDPDTEAEFTETGRPGEGDTRWIFEPEIDAQQVDEMVNEQLVVIALADAKRAAEGDFIERKDKMRKIELKDEERAERAAEVAVVERRESMNKLAADRLVMVHGVEFSTAKNLDNWKKVKYARELNARGRICRKKDKWLEWESVKWRKKIRGISWKSVR